MSFAEGLAYPRRGRRKSIAHGEVVAWAPIAGDGRRGPIQRSAEEDEQALAGPAKCQLVGRAWQPLGANDIEVMVRCDAPHRDPAIRLHDTNSEFFMDHPPQEKTLHVSLDTAVELSFDYLKQLGTVAMTAAGGLIALVQFVDGDKKFFIKIMLAAGLMFLSALLAFFVQFSLMDRIRQSHEILRKRERTDYPHAGAKKLERLFEGLALWLLSISMGIALQALIGIGMPS